MKKKKVKPVKQMGSTGTKLQKEVAAMEEAMKQHHIEEQCQLLIDEMMPQIKRLGRSLSGTYHRNIIEYTTSRIKSPESIVEKLHRKNREVSLDKAVETLRDLAGIRVICSFQDDVYRVAGAIKNLPGYELVKEKNYINKPKASGLVCIPSSRQLKKYKIFVLPGVYRATFLCRQSLLFMKFHWC